MGKKHKRTAVNEEEGVHTEEDNDVGSQLPLVEHSNHKNKKKKSGKREEKLEVKIEAVNGNPDKTLPLIGYFPSGFDHGKHPQSEPEVRVFKHAKRAGRLQLVVKPSESSPVNFVGTNYSGEAAIPQVCTYALGVLDKETQTLKIVQIESNKIFRLEPRFGNEDEDINAAKEAEKEAEKEDTREAFERRFKFSTKKRVREATKEQAIRLKCDPKAQEDLNNKMAEAEVNEEAVVVSGMPTTSARNIPPHDMSATTPHQAYPLGKIIEKGEWNFLLDVHELLQSGKDVAPDAYPMFVCNRIHKIEQAKDNEIKENLACVFSYINHLIKFKDKHSMDGFSSAKHHKFPPILNHKFKSMFGNAESKRLADDKRDLLVSYVLVLTLIVDNFKTEFSDIAKDLRTTTGALRRHFEYLGCKFVRENKVLLATLPAPLKFPEARMRRHK